MAAYIRPLGSVLGHFNGATEDFIVQSAATITNGDFVSFAATGTLGTVLPSTTGRIIGTAQSTVVGDGTKTVKVLMFPYVKYLVANDNLVTTFSAVHVGQYFNIIGATGAQLVDTSSVSTSNGQLLCLAFNPAIDPVRSDATWGIFTIAQYALDSENT